MKLPQNSVCRHSSLKITDTLQEKKILSVRYFYYVIYIFLFDLILYQRENVFLDFKKVRKYIEECISSFEIIYINIK